MQIKVVYPDVDFMFSDNVSADAESEKTVFDDINSLIYTYIM